jgi:hypothetical protein
MRRHESVVCLSLAGLALALAAAGCSGPAAVTGPDGSSSVSGAAVLQGAIVGAGLGSSSSNAAVHALAGGSGFRVSVVGTPLSTEVDEEGQFALAGVPAGSVRLRIEGPGVSAQLEVSGLVDGQVTSIQVRISGGVAELASAPTCAPTAETFFSGTVEQVSGTRLVVSGRPVDVSEIKKVWRGERRAQLSDLQVGDQIKVFGTLRGDGVVLAEEIAILSSEPGGGGDTWVRFTGTVESVSASSLDLHGNPNSGSYPTLIVKGTTVRTNEYTKVARSDGAPMSASEIRVGQTATVEGWRKPDGSVRATGITVDGAGSGTGGTWASFKGRVESVTALDAAGGVHVSCVLKMKVAGRYVQTDGSTVFLWSDGSSLDPYAIVGGDQAYVEGWSKPEGYVLATKVVVDRR